MKIMLLSANTGEGHNSSGKAIMEVLQARGVSCDMFDTLSFLSPAFSKFICDWHLIIYQHGGKMFDRGYRFLENIANGQDFSPLYELLSLGAGKLRDLVIEGDYDGIVCVHPFAGVMLTDACHSWDLAVPTFFAATDYTCAPTVEQCNLDTFFLPAKDVRLEFSIAGIAEENQFVSGIAVRQVFYQQADRAQARQALNLPQDSVVALVMCGSLGGGVIQKIATETLEHMPENSVMVAVCGRSEKLYEEMSQIADPRLRVLGFVDNIPQYLDAVDFLVTKPGGLTSTEAANKHVPMVFFNTVGGCESRNFDLFLKNGYALGSTDPEEVVRIAIRMSWDSATREKIRTKLQQAFTVNTGEVMADCIMQAAQKYRESLKNTL